MRLVQLVGSLGVSCIAATWLSGCLSKLDDLDAGTGSAQLETTVPQRPGTSATASGDESSSATAYGETESSSSTPPEDAAAPRTCADCLGSPSEGSDLVGADADVVEGPECGAGTYRFSGDGGSVECRPCEPGTFSFDPDSPRCAPHRRCDVGTFAIATGTAQRDVVCAGCPSGYFADEAGLDTCVKWRDCEIGQFVSALGTSAADRQCQECAEGETSVDVNSGACTAAGQCPPGTVQTAPGVGEQEPVCSPCSAGSYCAGGDEPAVQCAGSTWDDDANAATPCSDKTTCLSGSYVLDPGSSTQDRTCRECTEGFSAGANAAQCEPWSACVPGQYIAIDGTSLDDRVCADCDSGTFSDVDNAAACQSWQTCRAPRSYVAVTPTAGRDRACDACVAPEVALQDNAAECVTAAFEMAGGQVVIEAEHYHLASNQTAGDHSWLELENPSTSGDWCMELTPDLEAVWTASPAITAPKLEFNVNFTQTGTFFIHVRGDAGAKAIGTSDSCYAGIDGVATPAYTFPNTVGVWAWATQSLSVTTTGLHVLQIFGREDGFRVDKVLVSTSNVAPSGDGPAESSQTAL